ncbi:hypothetical protein FPQ18DRAFT_381223 [Pyronema domesticum]|uniref:Uncharacterized protein n=1 Tax=Pyronema omphalodes (strain CBS 100304) TaxID=1076935 RepID=U4KU75_PYROM|nr:hypothetical protein FPQ18DRAFT_381223 [Pyronema domesticum]CCX04487.1 Protein of unknown function [Pyronema omphalodes CBS 100304]
MTHNDIKTSDVDLEKQPLKTKVRRRTPANVPPVPKKRAYDPASNLNYWRNFIIYYFCLFVVIWATGYLPHNRRPLTEDTPSLPSNPRPDEVMRSVPICKDGFTRALLDSEGHLMSINDERGYNGVAYETCIVWLQCDPP